MADCRLGHRARASRPGADGGRGRWWRTRRGPRAGATGAPRRGSFEAAPMKRASPSRACSHGAEPPPADYPASARTARNCTPSERPRASPLPDILKVPEQPASAAVDDGTGRHRGLLPRRRCSRLRRRGGTMVRPPAQAEGVALVGTPANLEAVAANLDGGRSLPSSVAPSSASTPPTRSCTWAGTSTPPTGRPPPVSRRCAGPTARHLRRQDPGPHEGRRRSLHLPAVRVLDENNVAKLAPLVPVLQCHGLGGSPRTRSRSRSTGGGARSGRGPTSSPSPATGGDRGRGRGHRRPVDHQPRAGAEQLLKRPGSPAPGRRVSAPV